MTLSERIAIYQVVRDLKGDVTCVEIGSYLGASACFICRATSKRSRVICIDTWQNDAMKYDPDDVDADARDTHAEFVRNTHRFREKIVQIRKWSHEAVDDVSAIGKQIDFLFIDGDHSYEGVKRDWDLYSPLLAPHALIAFHDTGWADGVKRVVRNDVTPVASRKRSLPNLQIFQLYDVTNTPSGKEV